MLKKKIKKIKYHRYWVVDDYNLKLRCCECRADCFAHFKKQNCNKDIFWNRESGRLELIRRMEAQLMSNIQRASDLSHAIVYYKNAVPGKNQENPSTAP